MKKTTILIFMAMVIFGCKKSFLDINQNPNQPTVVTPNVVLSAALEGSSENIGNDYLKVNNLMGFWSRSGNYVSDGETESYNIPNNYTDVEWGNMYNTLNRYDYIEKQGHANNLPFYVGVAKVMKAVHFSTLVDIYGDVPYTDAFNVVGAVQPKYDKAQDIYNDLVKQLDSAVTYFDSATAIYNAPTTIAAVITTDDQYDIMFGKGKGVDPGARMDKWVQFANTVKLRLLVHEYKVADPAYITTEIGLITGNGRGLIGPDESATVNPGYAASANQVSPFVANFQLSTGSPTNNAAYFRANSYGVNFYLNTGDIRQTEFYKPVSGITVVGNFEGDPESLVNTKTSAIGGFGGVEGIVKTPQQDQIILSDFESLFLQAEAVQRGWLTGDAKALYESAVTQSFIYLAFEEDPANDAADAAAYLAGDGLTASPGADFLQYIVWDDPSSTDKIKLIVTQKWAALNGINWVEAWTDYRRTGFPNSDILGLSFSSTHVGPTIPIRYLYPQTELNANGANVPKLVTSDLFTDPIFWAK
jgi:hypothetical protein